MSLIHYIFVRKDLPLGVMAAMITHAAGESGAWWGYSNSIELPAHTTAVVLEADSEAHLEKIRLYLVKESLEFEPIYESSDPYIGQLMAIGLWPEERSYFRDSLAHFKLLKSCKPEVDPMIKIAGLEDFV